MAKTGHYEQWRTDFDMVKEMGMEFLRDGPPCYCTHTAAGVYDWNITDITIISYMSWVSRSSLISVIFVCPIGSAIFKILYFPTNALKHVLKFNASELPQIANSQHIS